MSLHGLKLESSYFARKYNCGLGLRAIMDSSWKAPILQGSTTVPRSGQDYKSTHCGEYVVEAAAAVGIEEARIYILCCRCWVLSLIPCTDVAYQLMPTNIKYYQQMLFLVEPKMILFLWLANRQEYDSHNQFPVRSAVVAEACFLLNS